MALWAGFVALLLALFAFLTPPIDYFAVLRGTMEFAAVLGVFALICAAEASN